MKLISLTKGKFAIVDDADYEWISQWKWCAKEGRNTWYARRSSGRRPNRVWRWMHRELLQPGLELRCDHINRDGLDNRRANLRAATNQQNEFNSTKKKQNSSGFKGVTFCKYAGRWKAQIEISGVNKHLGRFDTAEAAYTAYATAARQAHGEFSCL